MPPVGRALAVRFLDKVKEFGEGAVETVGGAGKDAVDGAKGVVDAGKDAADIVNKAKDAMALYEEWKGKVMGYYQWYLDHKWLIQLAAALLLLMIFLCWLQCVCQYLCLIKKTCCCTIKCGVLCVRWSGKYGWPCCLWTGRMCLKTEKCIPGIQEMRADAAKRGKLYDGFDSTWCARGCGHDPMPDDEEKANELRWVYKFRNWPCVPASWRDQTLGSMRLEKMMDKQMLKGLSEQAKTTLLDTVQASVKTLPKKHEMRVEWRKTKRSLGKKRKHGKSREDEEKA